MAQQSTTQPGTSSARPTGRRIPAVDEQIAVQITADGYLRLPPAFCAAHFPHDRCTGLRQGTTFILMPSTVYAWNGIIMKQRTLAGERSTLIREVWGDDHPVGEFTAMWRHTRRRLVVDDSRHSDSE